ncbi:MAG: hypothetical protein ACHREM_15685 [Polyangiales bacterium]
MEWTERLAHLEAIRDWQGLRDELEKAISAASSNEDKAALHLKVGRLLNERFLNGARALKHFQDAFKLLPTSLESLDEARGVYWDLGKLNMVQKLLELELKTGPGAELETTLACELGDVQAEQDQHAAAVHAYIRAVTASAGASELATALLADAQVDDASWDARVAELMRAAHATSGAAAATLALRAARIVRRLQGVEATEGFLRQAYKADPESAHVSVLFEGLLADQKRVAELESTQLELLSQRTSPTDRAALALVFARRWALRHQNLDLAVKLLEDALAHDPTLDAAFFKLVEIYGSRDKWSDALKLADRLLDSSPALATSVSLLSAAALVAWKNVGDLTKARGYFSRLAYVLPDHSDLAAFERQIGDKLQPRGPNDAPEAGSLPPRSISIAPPKPVSSVAPPGSPSIMPVADDELVDDGTSATVPPQGPPPPIDAPPPVAGAAPVVAERPVVATPAPAIVVSSPTPPPVAVAPNAANVSPRPPAVSVEHAPDEAKVADLRGQLAKFEAAKRWGDVAKTLVALVTVLADDFDRVESAARAADIYANQLRNQVEAIKAYELVRTIEPNNATAVEFLVKAYEARREYEKLLSIRRQEADDMAPGPVRAAKFAELARLATEKVKKPEVCIAYWREVLDSDGDNLEAIGQLAGFYERAKDFEALVTVLEKEVELTHDRTKQIATLKKLGSYYGDRLSNDDGAVEAWRRLLAIDPNDKQAQEALKKKYLALHRWDDLETFFAESGKWDEFIRILEQQEAKETEVEAKSGLLFKIAQLWNDRKQKADRAAKAYERVLELDPTNLRAAEALVPIYQATHSAAALARVDEVRLGHAEDPVAKLELLRELGGLYEGKDGTFHQRSSL